MRSTSYLTNFLLFIIVGLFAYWVFISYERNRNELSGIDLIRGGGDFNKNSVKQMTQYYNNKITKLLNKIQ